MAKMKAAVVNPKARHGVEITEREIRPLRFNEALVEVEYCGRLPHRFARCRRRLRR